MNASATTRPTPPQTAGPLRGFGVFVELERRARQAASLDELAFIVVNETCSLARYRQALLWRRDGAGRGRVMAVSGLAAPEREAPFLRWVERLLATLDGGDGPRALTAADLDGAELDGNWADGWAEWLPAHALWLPLNDRDGRRGALILARETAFAEQERHLLERLAEAYAHAWGALAGPRRSWREHLAGGGARRAPWALALVALLGAALFPVRESALAPAEIVARDPALVRAPIDGVVDRFAVAPNETVAEGQALLMLDATRLLNRLDVARKAFEVAEAEYRQAAQQAVSDARTKASLATLKGRMEQEAAEVAYVEELLQRVVLRAPRAGLAIFDDPNEWLGRPVAIGERILLLADPAQVEVEVHLAVGDAIDLAPGAPMRLFLNTDPHRPLDGVLRYAAYQAAETPSGVLAYRMVATLAGEGAPPRIGLKGTAKLYGAPTVLVMHLLRRPLAALRQWAGL